MKTTIIRVIVIVLLLVGVWYVWPENTAEPEVVATLTASPSATPLPSATPTKTPVKTPVRTSTSIPTRTPTSDVGATPTINSVTAYQMTTSTATEPSGWWIRIVGTLTDGCMQLVNPSFYRDGNTFVVSLPATRSGEVCTQVVRGFTQTIRLSDLSLAPGLYTVSVNGKTWTSFIISTPTPTPVVY